MANAIPILEGTQASGGYLVPDEQGETLQNGILRESAVLGLARVDRVAGRRRKYTVYAGRPTAGFVAEGGPKGTTGAEWAEVEVDVKKIAANVLYTEEILEDAREDPRVLVSQDVEGAIADVIDAHALGMANGTPITSEFNTELTTTTSTVEYVAATPDSIARNVSAAMSTIEGNGYKPNGIILASDGRGVLRDARQSSETTAPVYTPGFDREPDSLYGLPIRYSTNLDRFATTPAAGTVVGIVGDFTHAVFALRKDVEVRFSDSATIDVGGTLHHLWQQNKVASQWETRIGFFAHDLNRAFVAILNAA